MTLKAYGILLVQFIHALLLTLQKDPPTDYQFPLDPDQVHGGLKLINILNDDEGDVIEAIHQFSLCFLAPRNLADNIDNYSKWDDPLECLIAIHCLNEDGNFKRPHEVTQLFAKLKYLIRGATLLEGIRHKEEFDNDIYR